MAELVNGGRAIKAHKGMKAGFTGGDSGGLLVEAVPLSVKEDFYVNGASRLGCPGVSIVALLFLCGGAKNILELRFFDNCEHPA
jgi:hypothetical protein